MTIKTKNAQAGIAHLAILLILLIVAGVGFVGWRVLSQDSTRSSATATGSGQKQAQSTDNSQGLLWQQTQGGWQSTQTPPDCPSQPVMKMPVDISKVTAVLYPGQTRGGNYKPHGGFRFDNNSSNEQTVAAPIDGYLVRGGQYLAEGEVQYSLDVMNNCGVMYRVGHLRVLPDNLKKIADTWPQPIEGDSRTQNVNPAVYIKQGATLGTTVGIIKDKNVFFDWGVYDFRQTNEASKSSSYQAAHAQDKELSWHAVCWFDWLPASDSSKVKALPAGDPTSGKNSDYCK